ncbi:MAG: hypothetical protein MI746_11205 [Pseudomonadales bacterium]|nr:hypothetical protein [Pseudomonadales bacterium]
MQQQINLYLPEFQIKKDPVTALLMGQVLGGVLGVMVLVSAFNSFIQWRLSSELEALQVTLQEETRRTDQLDEELARRSQNTELTNRLEQAEARLEARIQIRDFLGQTQLGNVAGFSEYFKDLSRARIDGLSISEFELRNGGDSVRIVGQTLDSATVPRYVDNIERGQSPLRNKQYSPSIGRNSVNEQVFDFELLTQSE